MTPLQIEALKRHLFSSSPTELTVSTIFPDSTIKDAIHGLLMGPRDFDAFMLHRALSAPSPTAKFSNTFKYTWMLSLVLLGRKNGDLEAIKAVYRNLYGETLFPKLKEALRKEDLLHTLYFSVLSEVQQCGSEEVPEAERASATLAVERDADELFTATVGAVEGDVFSRIFARSTTLRLREIATKYAEKRGVTLTSTIEKKLKKQEAFRDELLYVLRGLEDQEVPRRDAELLENTMKGLG